MRAGRRWTCRAVVWAVLGLSVILAVATGWLPASGARGAEMANVWALPVAVAGLVATVLGWSRRTSAADRGALAAAARALARDVAELEAVMQQRLLSDTGDVHPADVGFAQVPSVSVHRRPDGGDRQGSLEKIADFYRGLERARLVVLGEPGAGKVAAPSAIAPPPPTPPPYWSWPPAGADSRRLPARHLGRTGDRSGGRHLGYTAVVADGNACDVRRLDLTRLRTAAGWRRLAG
jgi:hypothetical protein